MSSHLLTLAIVFASVDAAVQATKVIRERTPAKAAVAPLGSLEYGHARREAIVAARVSTTAVAAVRELADERGGRVLEERAVPEPDA